MTASFLVSQILRFNIFRNFSSSTVRAKIYQRKNLWKYPITFHRDPRQKKSSGGVRKWRLFDFKWFFSLRGEPMTCLNYKINQDEIKIHKKISAERIVQKLLVQLLIQVNFMYSKKATKFCEISTFCGLLLPSQNIWSLNNIVN